MTPLRRTVIPLAMFLLASAIAHALKIALHRACIARMFEQNDLVLDGEEIHAIAKTMVG